MWPRILCSFFSAREAILISRDERKLFLSPLLQQLHAVKVKFLITKKKQEWDEKYYNWWPREREKNVVRQTKLILMLCAAFFAQYTKEIIYFLLTSVESDSRASWEKKEISEALLWRLISSHNIFCLTLEKISFLLFCVHVFQHRSHLLAKKVMQKIFDESNVTELKLFFLFSIESSRKENWGIM